MGESEKERAILEEARNYAVRGSKAVTRALGAACVRAYNQSTERTRKRRAAIAEALDCYLDLVDGDAPVFRGSDESGRCVRLPGNIRRRSGEFLDMREGYPDDYRIYMRLALLYCSMEAEKAEEERDYSLVKENYDLAAQYYRELSVGS